MGKPGAQGDVIRYVLEQCGLEPDNETIGRCVMWWGQGARCPGARECGMECVGVLYGYGAARRWSCRPAWIGGDGEGIKRFASVSIT